MELEIKSSIEGHEVTKIAEISIKDKITLYQTAKPINKVAYKFYVVKNKNVIGQFTCSQFNINYLNMEV